MRAWAFSTAEEMAAFLAAHKDAQWETRLIDRYSAPAVISKLQADGFLTISYDANSDGTGGINMQLSDFLDAFRNDRLDNYDSSSRNC